MLRKPRRLSMSRLACLGLATSVTVSLLIGCEGEATAPSQVSEEHGKAVSKNMEDFMKSNPYKNVGKEKVQIK